MSISADFPIPSVPFVDSQGRLTQTAVYFLQQLYRRTGGAPGAIGAPGGATGNVQYNSGGIFAGLTDIGLTARIQTFTASVSGAVPASGGGTAAYLRADGAFASPSASGAAAGDLSGTYPNPSVVKINGSGLGSTAPTSGHVLIANGTQWDSVAVSGDISVTAGGVVAVEKIAGAALGTTTPTSGNLLVGSGAAWASQPVSGDVSLSSAGGATVSAVNGVSYPASPAVGTVPIVAALGVVTYQATVGTGDVVLSSNPTLAGVTVNGAIAATSQTSGPGIGAGTLTNAPAAGNPTFWVPISVNGTLRHFPAW